MIARSYVFPCDLWIVTAQARRSGNCVNSATTSRESFLVLWS